MILPCDSASLEPTSLRILHRLTAMLMRWMQARPRGPKAGGEAAPTETRTQPL